jgi:hypothetical protein
MKMTIELDCTAEEARQFLGLPDVTEANAAYIDAITKAIKGETSFEQLQLYAKQMAPVGQMGLKLFQQVLERSAAAGFGGDKKAKAKD